MIKMYLYAKNELSSYSSKGIAQTDEHTQKNLLKLLPIRIHGWQQSE